MSSPKAPDVATIADDDPVRISLDKQRHYNLLNQGWVQHETMDFDDASSNSEVTKDDNLETIDYDDASDVTKDDKLGDVDFDGNRDCSTAIAINAININLPSVMHHADVLPYVRDSDDSSVASSILSCASLIIQEDAFPVVDDGPDALQAQIDSFRSFRFGH